MKSLKLFKIYILFRRALIFFYYKIPSTIKNFIVGHLLTRLNKRQCRICGHKKTQFIRASWDRYLLKCLNCNTYFTSELLPNTERILQEFSIFSEEEYRLKRERFIISDKNCAGSWFGWVDWKKQTFTKLKLEDFESKLGKNRMVLEIGCAEGKSLELLRDRGWKVIGLDISEYQARLCRQLKLNVIVADAQNISFRDGCFNLIVMFHVLEHITNPILAIKNIFVMLKNGGRFILEVPCINNAEDLSVDFKNTSHHFFFNEKAIQYILNTNGFTCLDKFIYEDQIHKPKRNICYLAEKR